MTLCLGGEYHDMQFGKDGLAVSIDHGLLEDALFHYKGSIGYPDGKGLCFCMIDR